MTATCINNITYSVLLVSMCSRNMIEIYSRVCVCVYSDFSKVYKACRKEDLEGNRLTVSKVPISNCLLVTGLEPSMTKGFLKLYFQSGDSSGGTVQNIEMNPEEGKCFIYFEDHKGEKKNKMVSTQAVSHKQI